MTEMPELLPCPFCGGEQKLDNYEYWDGRIIYRIACSGCGVSYPHGFDKEEQITAWNRRADGWISVEDALPEPRELVLGWVLWGLGGSESTGIVQLTEPNEWGTSYWMDAGFNLLNKPVTHWQPMPPPPAD